MARIRLNKDEAELILEYLPKKGNMQLRLKLAKVIDEDEIVDIGSNKGKSNKINFEELDMEASISSVRLTKDEVICATIESKVSSNEEITIEEEEFYFRVKGYRL